MSFYYILDIIGTVAFALSGAFHGIKHRLDLLGVLILATVTGIGGGVIRDLMIGYVPPVALRDNTYIWICLGAGLLAFYYAPMIAKRWPLITFFDAIGLGFFTAVGSSKAMTIDIDVLGVIFCGTITGVGGGIIRDILTEQIPSILKTGFYASSAIIGSTLFLLLTLYTDIGMDWIMALSAAITVIIRLYTLDHEIHLPVAKRLKD
jgi:uncharacterized membrane protein YeiH